MAGPRRLSQRIAEGDEIALIVRVVDAAGARAAEESGARAVAVDQAIPDLRSATSLPVLWVAQAAPVDADAMTVRPHATLHAEGLEIVVDVRDEDELEHALEHIDPEIFLLSGRHTEDGEDQLETVLGLLPDVPAGKLAIADLAGTSDADVRELERAGIDAVLVDL